MTHEDFTRKPPARHLKDRTFGLVFAAILCAIGLLPLVRHHPVRGWALAASAAFLLTALAAPAALGPVQRVWMRFGHAVTTVISHAAAAVLLLAAFLPARLALRLAGEDPLAMRWDPRASSYWIHRNPPGPPPATMKNQF